MSIYKTIREFFLGPAIDEFENFIYKYGIKNLPEEKSKVLESQFELFNNVYRYYKNEDQEDEVYVCHFYWYKYFKNKLDFPLLFPVNNKEEMLCEFEVILYTGEILNVSIWVVLGIACYIEIRSDSRIYRPLSPDFECRWLSSG